MKEILKLEDMVILYPSHHRIFNGVSVVIASKEAVCICGKAGSGKTVMMKVMSGLEKANLGKVFLFGNSVCEMSEKSIAALRAEKISIVDSGISLFDEFTVYENIILPYSIRNSPKNIYTENAKGIIKTLRLERIMESRPCQITLYQKVLTCLARAVITKPEIMFFDSFEYCLSDSECKKVWEYIDVIHKFGNCAMVFFSDYPIKKEYIDKTYEIKNGLLKEV